MVANVCVCSQREARKRKALRDVMKDAGVVGGPGGTFLNPFLEDVHFGGGEALADGGHDAGAVVVGVDVE